MRKAALVLVLMLALMSLQQDAQAHDIGYNGIACYWEWSSYGWEDCLDYTYNGSTYVSSGGWGYHYVYGGYTHYWWYVPQYSEEHLIGWCWNDPVWGCTPY